MPVAAKRTGGADLLAVRDMTRAEANAQVVAIMDELETGINERSPERALAGLYKGDVGWLSTQRRWVDGVIERLNGHRGDLRFAHPSYWAHFEAGSREVVSHHTDRSVTDVSKLPVVYVYSP